MKARDTPRTSQRKTLSSKASDVLVGSVMAALTATPPAPLNPPHQRRQVLEDHDPRGGLRRTITKVLPSGETS